MAMILANNLSAINTLNEMRRNVGRKDKDMAKLSTGMKINSAGDDTSGYSISERMRAQIRGLNSCSDNVKTGYNMLSTASEAVSCQLDILKKMREATLKASDDTYSQKDRDVLAIEADELFSQIDLIAEETTYNGMYLLNRRTGATRNTTRILQETTYNFDPMRHAVPNDKIGTLFTATSQLTSATSNYYSRQPFNDTINGLKPTSTPPKTTLDLTNALAGKQIEDLNGQGFSVLCTGCYQFASVVFDTSMPLGSGERQPPDFSNLPSTYSNYKNSLKDCRQYIIGLKGANSVDDVANALCNGILDANRKAGSNVINGTSEPDNVIGKHGLYVKMENGNVVIGTSKDYPSLMPIFYEGTKGASTTVEVTAHVTAIAGYDPWEDKYIQSGTKAGEKTAIRLWNTSMDMLFPSHDSLFLLEPEKYPTSYNSADYPDPKEYPERYEGYFGTDEEKKQQLWRDQTWHLTKAGARRTGEVLRTRESAARFLDDLDQAIKYVLHVQTDFGSQMMRMEISGANITLSQENTMSSESTIRDADMAKEMMNFTRDNLLAQSSQSMLAQANQSNNNVLSLLQ